MRAKRLVIDVRPLLRSRHREYILSRTVSPIDVGNENDPASVAGMVRVWRNGAVIRTYANRFRA